jgi:hypothetical protein
LGSFARKNLILSTPLGKWVRMSKNSLHPFFKSRKEVFMSKIINERINCPGCGNVAEE